MNAILVTVGTVLLSAAFVYSGNGLQAIILPLRGVAEGFPTPVLGLMGTAYAIGFVSGCVYGPLIVRRVGHIRAFAVFAAIAAIAILIYVLVLYPIAWLGLRVVTGFALAGMVMVVESWLNERAENSIRGRVFGAYMLVNYVASTGGQLTAGLGDPKTFTLFALACVLLCTALIPVGLTTGIGPAPISKVQVRPLHIFKISPVGAVAAFVTGISGGTFGTMAAVFVSQNGFDSLHAALFVSAAVVGAAMMQLPAGYISDRIDRRWIIVFLSSGAAIMGLWMGLGDSVGPLGAGRAMLGLDPTWTWILAALVFGLFSYPIYGISVAHMNDHVEPQGFVEASSAFLLLWGLGAGVGPFIASLAMVAFSPNALFLTTASAHGTLALYALYRMTRRASPGAPAKSNFVPSAVAGRTTPASVTLDPRAKLTA